MPARADAPTTPFRRLSPLLILLAAIAAILWLLPLCSRHGVLFPSGPDFADILVYRGRFTLLHTARFFTSRAFSAFAYPAGAAPIYAAFYATADPVETYLVLAAVASLLVLTAAFVFLRRNRLAHLFPWLLLFSFPLIFLIQRANIELLLWLLILAGILAFRRGLGLIAAILFGLAAAIKLYPIFLLGLFLKRKRDLPAFAAGILTALLALAAAIAWTGPTFARAAIGFSTGLGHFQDHYVDTVSKVEVAFDHSLFSPFKYQAFLHHASPASWTQAYYFAAGLLALLLFLRVRTFPFLNRLVFLTAAMVALPPVSFNYTLVHLYLPTLLLLAALAATRTPPATAVAALALLLLLLLPLIGLSVMAPQIPAGPMQACMLFAILLLAVLTPWPQSPLSAQAD